MRKIKFTMSFTCVAGARTEDVIEVDDDTTDEELDEMLAEWVSNWVDSWWEKQ